jgi:predicted esterase YcpF (UPF0227 family)
MSAPTHLLYLHGFRSSPQSTKARQMGAWMQQHRPDVAWWCPALPPSPQKALQLIEAGVASWPRDRMAIVGSSLGGFYATVFAERLGCRAVLLNPAVHPDRDLARHIGETSAWHSDDRFFFEARFIDELAAMTPPAITCPERYLAVIAKGDEVLDWREMVARYAGCRIELIDGGDHALSDFATRHLPRVLGWLELTDR